MTGLDHDLRQQLRHAIDQKRRQLVGAPDATREWWHGTETGRWKKHCACDDCWEAARAARQRRRARDPEATQAYDREYKKRTRARARITTSTDQAVRRARA